MREIQILMEQADEYFESGQYKCSPLPVKTRVFCRGYQSLQLLGVIDKKY